MDYILFWNEVSSYANKWSHSNEGGTQLGPCLSSRALAIIHLAMYESFASIAQSPTYYPALPPAPTGASVDAGICGAAYVTLCALYPPLQPYVLQKLHECQLEGSGIDEGLSYGCLIAQIVLQDRGNDPSVDGAAHVPSMGKGGHRPDPRNPKQGFHGPNYGALSRGFAITNRWEVLPPPLPGSREYLAALEQVKVKGIARELFLDSANHRTPEETLIGLFWAYDGAAGIGTPPRLYNQIVQKIAKHRGNSQAQNARLFALVNVAMADAGILTWDAKYKYNLHRPIVGIREYGDGLGLGASPAPGLDAHADPTWLPLGAPRSNTSNGDFTPPFPAYPSGHATFGAAAFQAVRRFYGVHDLSPDNLLDGMSFVSDELDGITTDGHGTVRPRLNRTFPHGVYQMILENGWSRVFLGVHWSFDSFAIDTEGRPDLQVNMGGVPLGVKIANDIWDSGMKRSSTTTRYPLIPKLI